MDKKLLRKYKQLSNWKNKAVWENLNRTSEWTIIRNEFYYWDWLEKFNSYSKKEQERILKNKKEMEEEIRNRPTKTIKDIVQASEHIYWRLQELKRENKKVNIKFI